MKRPRLIRLTWGCGIGVAVLGCAQIAGVGGDYRLETAGAGGQDGGKAGTTSSSGGTGARGGADSRGGDHASPDGSGGSGAAVTASGGSSGESSAGNDSAGESNAGGESSAGAGGTAGNGVKGPVRVGYSEFHDSAFGNDNASSHLADASFALPADTRAGDLLLVFFGADHSLRNLSGTDLDAVGWKLIDQKSDYGTDGQATYLMYKFAGDAEPDPIVFPGINETPSGNGVQGLLSVYRGVNRTNPINAFEHNEISEGEAGVAMATTPTPSVTTTVDGCLLIAGLSPDSRIDAPVVSSWPDGFVEDQVSVVNPRYPYPLGWANIYSAERHLARAGKVPESQFVWSTGEMQEWFGALTFVLALAP